jgi:hypothetical protein
VEQVKLVRTQALQLWMNRTIGDMGWPYADRAAPVLCGWVEPYDTWAQMNHLIKRESWPEGSCQQIAYFCNASPDGLDVAPFDDPAYPKLELDLARQVALEFLNSHAKTIWGKGLEWSALVGYDPAQKDPLESQFVRINVDPSEQYVLSVKGSTQYRLTSGDSQFSNLVLAGDWTLVDVNLGCVEAAVQSGKTAAFAITGSPNFLFGAFRQKLPLARSAHA